MYITNDPIIAQIAQQSGVNWIFIDLERIGKAERQAQVDSVISNHSFDDIAKLRRVIDSSKLLVRINPMHEDTPNEIEQVLALGADIIMLPYFKTAYEVEFFLHLLQGRAKSCLLLETPSAVDHLEAILRIPGIDYIHIGLNDLHLGYGMKFMFELLADGTVEKLCMAIKKKGIPYGFGGIAQIGQGLLPAEYILAEHYRLGSQMVILSRSFCNAKHETIDKIEKMFRAGVSQIREYESQMLSKNSAFFCSQHIEITQKVKDIIHLMKGAK